MNSRVVRASARLEWQRNWHMAFKMLVTIALCGVLAATGPRPVMLFAILISGATGIVATFGGAMTAIKERRLGRVAWWRALPAPRFELVLGRLLGASVLGAGFGLGLIPMVTFGLREGLVVPTPSAIALLFSTAAIAGFGVAGLATGLALRFRVERVLMALFLVSFLLGDRFETAMESSLETLGRWLVDTAGGEMALTLPLMAVGVAVTGTVLGMGLARWAIATAMEHAVAPDSTGISSINWRHIHYPAGRRGAARAMAAMQLRLAAERLPQQLAWIVGGVVLLPFLPEQLASFAAFYLPVMAATIPTAIAGRTATARSSGTIEGFATLPVRREWLVLGSLAALATLSLLATGGMVLLRLAADRPIGVASAFALWGMVTGGAAVANGMAAWFRPRHLPIVVAVAVTAIAVIAVGVLPIVMAPVTGRAFAASQGLQVLVGCTGLLLVAPLGGALYGRGLERFELVRS